MDQQGYANGSTSPLLSREHLAYHKKSPNLLFIKSAKWVLKFLMGISSMPLIECQRGIDSCGGDKLGEPPKQGYGQCGNMRILLRQLKQILLGRSDVTRWVAFTHKSVNKNDYLEEYTGELIAQDEAERRGKIYDRLDSSFLFNLNDQWCIDACRKGDKLKFANHSSNPNCHCQVLRVGGEHRVGIFAKDCMDAKQELFYDYSYGNTWPLWARDPKKTKKDEPSTSKGRAKKNQAG